MTQVTKDQYPFYESDRQRMANYNFNLLLFMDDDEFPRWANGVKKTYKIDKVIIERQKIDDYLTEAI